MKSDARTPGRRAKRDGQGGAERDKSQGRTCALDLGAVRVGVAIDDELGRYAHPRGVLAGKDRRAFLSALKELVEREDVARFVIGLPLDMRGGEGDSARRARETAQSIANATGLDVELWDERLSTVQAQRALTASEVHGKKAKARIDEASAVVILQAWLDARAGANRSDEEPSDMGPSDTGPSDAGYSDGEP